MRGEREREIDAVIGQFGRGDLSKDALKRRYPQSVCGATFNEL